MEINFSFRSENNLNSSTQNDPDVSLYGYLSGNADKSGQSFIALILYYLVFIVFYFGFFYINNYYLLAYFIEIAKNVVRDPILLLEHRRVKNKYYPFQETTTDENEPVFRLEYRSCNFYYGLKFFSIFVFLCWFSMRQQLSYKVLLVCVSSLLFSLMIMIKFSPMLKLEIEQDGENYYFYRSNKLVYKGNVRDIYIRTKMELCPNNEVYYFLVLRGYGIDEKIITGQTKDGKTLKRQGKRMAYKLNLNFFDFKDISTEHTIRHIGSFNTFKKNRESVYNSGKGSFGGLDIITRMTTSMNYTIMSVQLQKKRLSMISQGMTNRVSKGVTGYDPMTLMMNSQEETTMY